ncbi:MAG TPA: hypothetical protein VEJ47_13580 [Candidatus Eremiobacteraceae bacterium]|nr:hypothetical protein [Candidatus Eremiobacteraceae bacterium]
MDPGEAGLSSQQIEATFRERAGTGKPRWKYEVGENQVAAIAKHPGHFSEGTLAVGDMVHGLAGGNDVEVRVGTAVWLRP